MVRCSRIVPVIGSANWVRHLVNFTSACVVSSLLWVSIGCTTTPSTDQVQGANSTLPPPCPVTLPNEMHPPGERVIDGHRHGNHGNGKLWTTLPTDGKLLITPEKDGSFGQKFPWWRAVRGPLTIRGRRLHAPGDPLRSHVPAGYGETRFQASGVYFPSEGCWEITGRAGDAELTFVVEVRVKR